MREHRLIDANAEVAWAAENIPEPHSSVVIQFLRDCGTIDPETLPIVRELREANLKAECRADALMAKILVLEEELKQIAEERDAAVEQLHGKCYTCKHNDTPFHSSGQRDEYKSALQNWHEGEQAWNG